MKYLKILIIVIIIIFCGADLKAQSASSKNADAPKIKILDKSIFSFRVIRNSSTTENSNQSSSKDNLYSNGVSFDWLYILGPKWPLSLEPTYQQKGYTNGLNKVKIGYINVSINFSKVKDIPLFITNDYFFIAAGFYGGYAINGKNINGHNNSNSDVKFGITIADERTRLDYGINFTTSICMGKIIELGFNFQPVLCNVLPKDLQLNGNTSKLSSLA